MILNQTAEYALRAMSCLAIAEGEGPLNGKQIAVQAGIPPSYLSKVMRRLVVAGLVESNRGHGGGFRLARPADHIRFVDILEAVDYRQVLGRCAFGMGECDPDHPCPLHWTWSHVTDHFHAWANATSLSVVREHPVDFARLPDVHGMEEE